MHAPGVEVRPLRQITGEAEFNEVYMTDVRVPDAAPHRRRRRGLAGRADHADERAQRDRRRRRWRRRSAAGRRTTPSRCGRRSTSRTAQPADKDRLMQLWVQAEVGRLTNMRAGAERPAPATPGPEVSIAKLALAELNKALYEFCIDLLGADGAGRLRLHVPPPRGPRRRGHRARRCATRSCGCGPTRSRAARRRSCATSSASRCSACPASRASTRTSPGAGAAQLNRLGRGAA